MEVITNDISWLMVTADKSVAVTFLSISNYISGRRVRTPKLVGVTRLGIVFFVVLLGWRYNWLVRQQLLRGEQTSKICCDTQLLNPLYKKGALRTTQL